jgi:excisionase family DNA binding protein
VSIRKMVADSSMRTMQGKASAASVEKFYTIEQIADCMEVSTRTVRRWIEQGLLVPHRINGLVRVSEADFQAFLAMHRDY